MGFEKRETFQPRLHRGTHAWVLVALLGFAFGGPPVQATPSPMVPAPPVRPQAGEVVELTLDNGWRFRLYPRSSAPTVSFETHVNVGAADDPEELSGMANLVKNLLFKGSSRIGTNDWAQEQTALAQIDASHGEWQDALAKGDSQASSAAHRRFELAKEEAAQFVHPEEFSHILEAAGGRGSLNAYTDQDSTRFVVSLPSNQIELWCWMESERFRDPVFREFFVERAALLEDQAARTASDNGGSLAQALRNAAFGEHPLGRVSAGISEDISRIQRAAALGFFRRHYGAAQMITSIVGDLDPASLLPMLERYFGGLPRGPEAPGRLPALNTQTEERRVLVESDSNPLLWIAWHVPPASHRDSAAIEIAFRLLGYARSSRLERRLTRTASMVSSLSVTPAWQGHRRSSLALIRCAPTLGVTVSEIEQAIYDEIEELTKSGPSDEELSGVKRVATADHYRDQRNNQKVASGLSSSLARTSSLEPYLQREQRLLQVTKKDVQGALRKWFGPATRTVATLGPPVKVEAATTDEDS